ncbi:MAG TPA: NAD(P)H-quinone oxidoreductase [Acidobacteriota bacterium]|nr:NAD(P)H-quinone oxidoreductase [Acidobacteriota bacterium]
MRAIIVTEAGGTEVLQVRNVEKPVPGDREVLIRNYATSLNRADLLQRKGRYPAPAGTRSDILGLECAGTVEEVGSQVTQFKPGMRVMALLAGEGYAEWVKAPEETVLPIPDNLSFEEAAAIPETFLTAYDALFHQLDLQMGEKLLIHAAGSGVGVAAIQLAHTAGIFTIGTARSPEKLERAKKLGLEAGILYEEEFAARIRSLTEGQGVDAVLDFVGCAYWHQNLSSLKIKGRMVVLGLLGGTRVEADLSIILGKRLKVIGSALRSRSLQEKAYLVSEFTAKVLPLIASGRIVPVIDRVFSFEEVQQAHQWMESNRNFGKIVLSIPS